MSEDIENKELSKELKQLSKEEIHKIQQANAENPDFVEKFAELDPTKRKKRGGKPGQTFPTRILKALAEIYEQDENASISEKLQAIQLSITVLPMRTTPKRKTDKDKAIIEALRNGGIKKSSE